MLEINVLQSNSKGNCIILSEGGDRIMIEAGIPLAKLRKMIDYPVTDVQAVFISHEHKDHCVAVYDLARLGIPCYMSKGTWKALPNPSYNMLVIGEKIFIKSGWDVLKFNLVHDAAEPVGFLIQRGGNKILYACDTGCIPYKFTGLTHILIECNHSPRVLNEKILAGELPPEMKRRLISNHMGLETVKDFLKGISLKSVTEIWLLHLSARHAERDEMIREIQGLTGKVVRA
jgi:phosphoribosyl 1,2-cyclic phosphodiesterase